MIKASGSPPGPWATLGRAAACVGIPAGRGHDQPWLPSAHGPVCRESFREKRTNKTPRDPSAFSIKVKAQSCGFPADRPCASGGRARAAVLQTPGTGCPGNASQHNSPGSWSGSLLTAQRDLLPPPRTLQGSKHRAPAKWGSTTNPPAFPERLCPCHHRALGSGSPSPRPPPSRAAPGQSCTAQAPAEVLGTFHVPARGGHHPPSPRTEGGMSQGTWGKAGK